MPYTTKWWAGYQDFKKMMTEVDEWLAQKGEAVEVVNGSLSSTCYVDTDDSPSVERHFFYCIVYKKK